MSELASHSTDYSIVEGEPPEVMGQALRVGSRLWASATLFFFFAFLFAYFYLRSLNSHGLFRPNHVDPSQTLGVLVTLALVAAAVLLRLGFLDHRADRRPAWRIKGMIAAGLLIAAVVLQIVAWSSQGFGPTDGGYASVYVGWTGLQVLFVVGLAYWLETTLATSYRYRGAQYDRAAAEGAGDPHRTASDIENPLVLVRPELEAMSFYAGFLAGLAIVGWVVLYLV
jgi:heme/copper-type cytochrome/quinol oxidase subunit 3